MHDDTNIPRWKRHLYELLAAEVSASTRYYDCLLGWPRVPGDEGTLFARVVCPEKRQLAEPDELPDLSGEQERRTAILLSGTFNHNLDIQSLLESMKPRLARTSRLVVVAYNSYFGRLYRLATRAGIRAGADPSNFVTYDSLRSICKLSGFELVRARPAVYVPWRLLGLGTLINKLAPALPLIRHLSLATVVTLRPTRRETVTPTLSIVIPARNERGNIEPALRRLAGRGAETELLFVEGNSSDGTWEEIQRVIAAYDGPIRLVALQQTGRGKNDAVRLGFRHATGHLLTILDADLTMPPELLSQFTNAYADGLADFVNGNRLVYPMEGEAMRFLNRLGNLFFARALGWVLGTRLGDTLCGTKLVARHDYERFVRWRHDFGDFDPFGDFELLFPAAILGLGIVEVPIRYRARTYGSTNIRRFRDGVTLLKMTALGFLKAKLGRTRT